MDNIRIYTEQDPVYCKQKRRSRSCGEASLTVSARKEKQEGQLLRSLEGLCAEQCCYTLLPGGEGERGAVADLQACTA